MRETQQPIAKVGPASIRRVQIDRWDGVDLRDVRGTYGDYLLRKVSGVFPDLGCAHLG